jgi:hypothetical protein
VSFNHLSAFVQRHGCALQVVSDCIGDKRILNYEVGASNGRTT